MASGGGSAGGMVLYSQEAIENAPSVEDGMTTEQEHAARREAVGFMLAIGMHFGV